MPFQPPDLMLLADELGKRADSQAHLRTAINRVYFAGHLVAVSRMVKRGWMPSGRGDDHGKVLEEMRAGKFRDAAQLLSRLRYWREHADYHVERPEPRCNWCSRSGGGPGVPDLVPADWMTVKAEAERAMKLLARM